MSTEEPHSTWERLSLLVPALFLVYGFVILPARETWTNYWLLRDGQQGKAEITEVLWTGHDGVAYRYRVNEKEYKGTGARNWENPKYPRVGVGEESVVYYSASHPWLSQLNRPPRTLIPEGLPVLILAWIMPWLFLVAIINPRSKWALQMSGKKANPRSS